MRYAFWDVALAEFRGQPLIGSGSGAFAIAWRAQPDKAKPALDAHSLYLETLGELGLVGAAALALFLGSVGLCAAGLYRRAPPAACGPLAGLLVFAVHAGLDWDWEMPAVTGSRVAAGRHRLRRLTTTPSPRDRPGGHQWPRGGAEARSAAWSGSRSSCAGGCPGCGPSATTWSHPGPRFAHAPGHAWEQLCTAGADPGQAVRCSCARPTWRPWPARATW